MLCIKNDGYEVDLEVGTVYLAVPDEGAAERERVRVVDDSGEDYLYPRDYFKPVELSRSAKASLTVG